ncbi:MAG: protein kinase [Chthoniobacterales bacterium]
MQTYETAAATCPECGTRIERGFSPDLGRCMVCLLQVGFEDPAEPDSAPLAPLADRIGTYRIERRDDGTLWELGRGAMGVTYRATDTSLQRPVALKIIDAEWIKRGAEARERFMREARTAAALRHPNVATVYQFGVQEETGQFFCAMELVEGETLEMRVRRTGPLDTPTVLEIALQIASALAVAEKQGLVHRDLKPANLMLVAAADETGAITVKVIDFGVAKSLAETAGAMGLTHGGFVGTPAFASPEQFTSAPVDVRSDIYSLGATLWYLLTGRMLFRGDSVEEICANRETQPLPLEQLKAARVPRRLVSLLVSMLAAEPVARPDVRELTSHLEACYAGACDPWKACRRGAVAATAVGLAAALFLVAPRWRDGVAFLPRLAQAEPLERAIAVLPFEDRNPGEPNGYIADGMRDELVGKLSQVRGLKVLSRGSSKTIQTRTANLREVGRNLGVEVFLAGSVSRIDSDIVLDLRLIGAETNEELWAQRYQRKSTEISALEGEIAQEITAALKVKVAPSEAERIRSASTLNPRAHELYLRARGLSGRSDEESQTRQIALLREAVAEDPQYATAWAELAGAYVHLGDVYRAPREILAPAREAALKAVALDDSLAAAHMVLAGIALTYDWNFPVARREFERAIALDPNSSVAHRLYGWYLARVERNFVAARQEMAKARELDPFLSWPFWGESAVAIAQGDYEGALRLAERVIEINSEFFYDEDPLAHVYVAMGRWKDAVVRYESLPASRFSRPNFELAIAYAHTGRTAEARRILEELEALSRQRYVDHTHLAAIHAALGEHDKAFAALNQAVMDRSARVYAARFYPWLSPLRDDPRFAALENKVAQSALADSAAATPAAPANLPEKSIAVLPFDNLSDDQANAHFAIGIQDQILSSVAKIADLKVISRTSAMQYKDTRRNLREIGEALRVAHVLEGSVQRAGNKVRVSAQLIDARDDRHLWAQTYDRDLADVFAIQSEIAQAIAGQLQARLSPAERAAIEQRPTADLAAFDLYTRAKTLRLGSTFSGLGKKDLLRAVALLDQAVAADPAFFLAWCELAAAHDWLYFAGHDHSPARLAAADAAIQAVLRLQPDAGEAHLASAQHCYHGYLDYDRARAELAIAQRTLPNDPSLFYLAGNIDRRQGRWAESTRNLERAMELDPRNVYILQNLTGNYGPLRRYAEMIAVLDRALAIAPKDVGTRIYRASVELNWRADPRPLHATIEAILADDPAAAPSLASARLRLAQVERDPEAAANAVAALTGSTRSTEEPNFVAGLMARVRGDVVAAQIAFTAARVHQEKLCRAQPDYAPALGVLALIDAALGEKEAALSGGRRAMELLPVTKDVVGGALMIEIFANICAWAGEKDLALEQLAISAQMPGGVNYGQLKLHPYWDPLRGDPRFEAIVASLAPK